MKSYLDFIHQEVRRIVEECGKDVQCYRFHLLLKERFPEAVALYTGNHVLSLIGGSLWDKNGLYAYPVDGEPRVKEKLIEAMEQKDEL